MRKTRGWTWLPKAVIALGFLAWNAPLVKAAGILDYSVAGAFTSGVPNNNVISYIPVANAQIDPNSNIPLGAFQVAPLAPDQTATYKDTQFALTLVPTSYNGAALNDKPITVTGELNGAVSGPYQSSVKVSFNPLTDGTFSLGTGHGSGTLTMLSDDQKLLVPSSAGGLTTFEGKISISTHEVPAPEPSTIALFLSTVGGLGLRRYVLARRQRNVA
jgi:hypothetical protein